MATKKTQEPRGEGADRSLEDLADGLGFDEYGIPYDDEPLSAEEVAALEQGRRDAASGYTVTTEEMLQHLAICDVLKDTAPPYRFEYWEEDGAWNVACYALRGFSFAKTLEQAKGYATEIAGLALDREVGEGEIEHVVLAGPPDLAKA